MILKLCCSIYSTAQQTEEGAEGTSSTEVASNTAAASQATTAQGRAITTVTQSTPAPGPSVPVRATETSEDVLNTRDCC